MGSSAEVNLEEFLARQSSWVRKCLHGDYAFTPDERADFLQSNWPEVLGQARDEYLELLKKCPERLREYRKLQKRLGADSALLGVPSLPPGAPRQDSLAREAGELERTGLSLPEIARSLNLKYPGRKDRKGNMKPHTAESVRKLLERRREIRPDKT